MKTYWISRPYLLASGGELVLPLRAESEGEIRFVEELGGALRLALDAKGPESPLAILITEPSQAPDARKRRKADKLLEMKLTVPALALSSAKPGEVWKSAARALAADEGSFPVREPAHNAAVAIAMGEWDAALGHLETARLAGDDPRIALLQAECFEKLGRFAEAEIALVRYVETRPADATGYCALGNLYAGGGESALAARYYRLALEADPNWRRTAGRPGFARTAADWSQVA